MYVLYGCTSTYEIECVMLLCMEHGSFFISNIIKIFSRQIPPARSTTHSTCLTDLTTQIRSMITTLHILTLTSNQTSVSSLASPRPFLPASLVMSPRQKKKKTNRHLRTRCSPPSSPTAAAPVPAAFSRHALPPLLRTPAAVDATSPARLGFGGRRHA